MKILKTIFFTFSLIAIGCSFSACGGSSDADQTGKEYTSAYVCPMHCEGSGSDKAGTCPVCKMDYVANEDFKGEPKVEVDEDMEHDHDSHEGHNH